MLNEEVAISGAFIYNGLRRFYEIKNLDRADDLFEVLYYLSIGLERLLKIAVVLLEHTDSGDQDSIEKSLITHNHLDLLHRIKQHIDLNLSTPHNELIGLLSTFYKTFRYDRFSLTSVFEVNKEKNALCGFLGKHLHVEFPQSKLRMVVPNEARYRKFIRKTVIKLSRVIYEVVETRATELGLYTYELRDGSKAQTVFLGKADISAEDFLWKELLVFFMNTKSKSEYLQFLRSIPPIDFDPELVADYLDCFQLGATSRIK
jgi:hypothetical protein